MAELDPRKQIILRAVILEYVADAEPVASDRIASRYELGVRSATVRNELAEMSELGYLEQPHTSAGRIPSDIGYRYYVDHMVEVTTPDAESQRRLGDATQRSEVLRTLLQESTKMLSRLTHQLTAATIAANTHLSVRNCLLSALGPTTGLLVVVFQNGHVENRMVDIPLGTDLSAVGAANEALRAIQGLTVQGLSRLKEPTPDALTVSLYTSLRQIGTDLSAGKIVIEGEEYMLAQPELRTDEALMREVMLEIENEDAVRNALERQAGITIGRENEPGGMQRLAVLRQNYQIHGQDVGTIAIIGPTRQNYDRNLTMLSFVAEAVSRTMDQLLPE